ncbi:hypothetical protein A2U01_0053597, partial [Trifolium medium]|nr:hypothetical protein [Trifolium medium]
CFKAGGYPQRSKSPKQNKKEIQTKSGSSLGEPSLAGRAPYPKVPRFSQEVSGCRKRVLTG